MKAEKVASEIYSALKNGRDSVSPGFFNKVYSHLIVKWLPVPALALLAKVSNSSSSSRSSSSRYSSSSSRSIS